MVVFVADRVALVQVFLRVRRVFPSQYNSTNTPSSYSCYPNLQGKSVGLWERSEINAVAEIWEYWIEKYFQFLRPLRD